MKSLSAWISKYKHFSLLSVFILLQSWFSYCERTLKPEYYMFSKLDMHIPFVKEFVVPYLFWYVYMGAALIYLGLISKKDYYRLYAMMTLGMTIALIIYMILPNGQFLRPEVLGSDIYSKTIRLIYSVDTPTNVAPSLHVFDSIAVHMALISCDFLKRNRLVRISSFICMISIIASTVFIKQHSIVDAMWGTLLAFSLYGVVYGLSRFVLFKEGSAKNVDVLSQ